jgi:hypothetical protein
LNPKEFQLYRAIGQQLPDWIGAHVRMFRFFGGSPRLLVPDNLKSGVHKTSFYDPEINRTYGAMATHYSVGILPARPAKPRDKAKVEAGVRFAQTYILGRLRRLTFFSLAECNEAIALIMQRMNERPMRKLGVSHRELFEKIERAPDVISMAVWLYFRFPLSLCMVEEMLAARGICVSYETVRRWAHEFGGTFSDCIRRLAPARGDKWHLDEVVVSIAGEQCWLWRAVDQNGFVLDVLLQKRRDARAARRLLMKLLKSAVKPPRVISPISSSPTPPREGK